MASQAGPFHVLGRFNSTRSPDIIYTVKVHLEIAQGTDKRISCNCPGWKFSVRRLGHHECKHTRHVEENLKTIRESTRFPKMAGTSVLEHKESASFRDTEIGRALRRRKDSPKRRLAAACDEAGVQLSNTAFRKLLSALRPYLQGDAAAATLTSSTPTDDVLRVITLD
jgi:predicted nucleic acid-binding Zn finger protein